MPAVWQARPATAQLPNKTFLPMAAKNGFPHAIDTYFRACPTAQEIASVNADVAITFEHDPTAGTLDCTAAAGSADLTRLQHTVYAAILMFRRLRFDAPVPWSDQPLYSWFVGSIRGLRLTAALPIAYGRCCNPDHVIALSSSNFSRRLRFYEPDRTPGVGIVMDILLHEARHSNYPGTLIPHTCPDQANDRGVAEMRASAVTYYFWYWMAEHTDKTFFDDPERGMGWTYTEVARMMANNTARRFCEQTPPLLPETSSQRLHMAFRH